MLNRIRTAIRNKQRLKWERLRKQGKRSYILYRGVIRWGGFMFVLYLCTDYFLRHEKLDWSLIAGLLIGCALIGYVWGICIWAVSESRFGYRTKQ